jgi:hypothetical protein
MHGRRDAGRALRVACARPSRTSRRRDRAALRTCAAHAYNAARGALPHAGRAGASACASPRRRAALASAEADAEAEATRHVARALDAQVAARADYQVDKAKCSDRAAHARKGLHRKRARASRR